MVRVLSENIRHCILETDYQPQHVDQAEILSLHRNIRDYVSIPDQKVVVCRVHLLADTEELEKETERQVGTGPGREFDRNAESTLKK